MARPMPRFAPVIRATRCRRVVMRAGRRKTLIVCAHCHGSIHQQPTTQQHRWGAAMQPVRFGKRPIDARGDPAGRTALVDRGLSSGHRAAVR